MMLVLVMILILIILYFFSRKEWYSNKLKSAVIIGCAKDISGSLSKTIEKLDMISNLFEEYKIIIYENDSKDDTLKQLQDWQSTNNNIEIISETNVMNKLSIDPKSIPPGWVGKTIPLAHGRNILMKRALEYNYEYIIVVDLDNAIELITEEYFLSSFDEDKFINWACIGSNSTNKYYDLWALRTYDDWCPRDVHKCVRDGDGTGYDCVDKRYIHIDENSKPIKVKSCFGGLAIYKTKYIKDSQYNGLNKEDNIIMCEHVSFNLNILDKNPDVCIYINPKMISTSGY